MWVGPASEEGGIAFERDGVGDGPNGMPMRPGADAAAERNMADVGEDLLFGDDHGVVERDRSEACRVGELTRESQGVGVEENVPVELVDSGTEGVAATHEEVVEVAGVEYRGFRHGREVAERGEKANIEHPTSNIQRRWFGNKGTKVDTKR